MTSEQTLALSARPVRPVVLAIAALAAVLAFSPAQAANLLTNGSFDDGNIGVSNYTYPGGVLKSWNYGGSALVNNQGYSAWYGSTAPAGVSGTQFAALQMGSSLSQSFNTTTSSLNLGWLAAGRPGMGAQSYNVLVDANLVGNFSTASGSDFGFNSLNLSSLTMGSHMLAFQGLVTGSDQTAFLDNVQLQTAAFPAPPSITHQTGDFPLPAGMTLIDTFDTGPAPGFSFTGGYVRSGVLDPGVSAPPPGDTTVYETVRASDHIATLTATRPLSQFSFYLGSPDSYNTVTFSGDDFSWSLSGSAIWAAATGADGHQDVGYRVNYDFGGHTVNKIDFISTGNSFEFDDLAGKVAAVPEPASWAMMILGFFGLGSMVRSKRQRRAAIA